MSRRRSCGDILKTGVSGRKGSKPEGQCHLGKEGANDEREVLVPEGFFASVLAET